MIHAFLGFGIGAYFMLIVCVLIERPAERRKHDRRHDDTRA